MLFSNFAANYMPGLGIAPLLELFGPAPLSRQRDISPKGIALAMLIKRRGRGKSDCREPDRISAGIKTYKVSKTLQEEGTPKKSFA